MNNTLIKAQHDSAWKDILDHYFPHAIEVCFLDLYQQIDWHREWVALDKELQSITKTTETGQRFVDKLVRVYLKDGSQPWILIHLEIEQAPDQAFPERMFIYGIRLFDKYRRPIVGCALLADNNVQIRPTYYEVGLGGARLRQDFLLCKLIDFEENREKLEGSANPFATVILFHLDALKAKKLAQEERLKAKIGLTKRLYNKGFQKQEILNIFRFLDFSIALPDLLEVKYQEEIHQIEVQRNMSYVSSVERISLQKGVEQGIQQGMQQGMQQGIEEVALRLLQEGANLDFIAKVTQLKLERLKELQKQMH